MMNVAVVDDQDLVLRGISELLRRVPDFDVVLELDSGEALLESLPSVEVDVVVMDIRMPGLSGTETVAHLRQRGIRAPVLMLTTFDDDALLLQAAAAGAQGFMLKDAHRADLEEALRRLSQGHTHFEPIAANRLRKRRTHPSTEPPQLSPRELEVLRLMAGGYSNREIAGTLYLAEGTVKNYVSEILAKLRTRDRTRAVLRAITLGIL